MNDYRREQELTRAFVTLADTLVTNYDVVELLQDLVDTTVHVLRSTAGGLLLADEEGNLSLVAATSEASGLVELLQIESGEGPCVRAFQTGRLLEVPDIGATRGEWPSFCEAALAQGYLSALSVPLRLRDETIGTLNLFGSEVGFMNPADVAVARGLADVATIGILHERAMRESAIAREQLRNALSSRVVIEQAKGVVAQLRGVDMDEAFRTLREYSRNNNLQLRDVATLVVHREITL